VDMVFSGPNVCGRNSIQKFCVTLCPSPLVVHTQLLITNGAIYAVGVAKSASSYALLASVLSATMGELLTSANPPFSIAHPLREFTVLTCILSENSLVKPLVSTPKLSNKLSVVKGAGYAQILDVGLSEHGQLAATREDSATRILKLDEDPLSLTSIWQFENSVCNVSSLACLLHSLLHDV
jgi:hypothetical protein